MSSVSKFVLGLALFWGVASFASTPPLRVCADASNLPFSNMREQGFENVLARMVGHDLRRDIYFVWLPQQEHFVEKRLKAQTCDLVMGAPSDFDLMVPTIPYYRSTYVFVSRRNRNIRAVSLTDPSLKQYRIAAHIIGDDDGAIVPPAEELRRRGMLRNIVGYSIYGHPLSDNPSAEIITAVENGDVDMAVAWGPLAGYFSRKSPVPLRISPICPLHDPSAQPIQFDISMGVRRGDDLLLEQLNRFIATHEKEVRNLLTAYGVPLVNKADPPAECH